MKSFFNALRGKGIPTSVTIPPEAPPSVSGIISVFNFGDSISVGTTNGTATAVAGTLEEYNGTTMIAITGDVINANTGSPYPSMAAKFMEYGADKLHIVNAGSAGSRVIYSHNTNHWGSSATLYSNAVIKANNYLTNQGKAKFDFIRITLAINDIFLSSGNTVDDIIAGYLDLIGRVKIDFPDTRILVNNIGYDTDNTLEAEHGVFVKFIQDLAQGDSLVYLGKEFLDFPFADYYDGIHMNQATNNLIGEYDATEMASVMSGLKPNIFISSPLDGQVFYQDKTITITSNIQE